MLKKSELLTIITINVKLQQKRQVFILMIYTSIQKHNMHLDAYWLPHQIVQ